MTTSISSTGQHITSDSMTQMYEADVNIATGCHAQTLSQQRIGILSGVPGRSGEDGRAAGSEGFGGAAGGEEGIEGRKERAGLSCWAQPGVPVGWKRPTHAHPPLKQRLCMAPDSPCSTPRDL